MNPVLGHTGARQPIAQGPMDWIARCVPAVASHTG